MQRLIFVFLLLPFLCSAQNNNKFYETVAPISFRELTESEIIRNSISTSQNVNYQVPPVGAKFTKLREFGPDFYVVEFWEWTKTKDESLKDLFNYAKSSVKTIINGNEQEKDVQQKKYFLIKKTDLTSCNEIAPRGFYGSSLAVTTVPFKVRLKDFDFYTSQTLGLALDFKWKPFTKRDFYVNALAGLNLSLVNLDSFSTRGVVEGQPINNVGVLSPMMGVVFELKGVQAGLMLGLDIMNKVNRMTYNWRYNGQPWLGIGLGVSILNANGGKVKEHDLTQGN